MLDLNRFGLAEALLVGTEIRKVNAGAPCLEAVAQRTARHFYDELRDGAGGDSGCVLARCYKTHAFGALPPELGAAAASAIPAADPSATTTCLTLLGTYGDRPEWRDRRSSSGHRAIPLVSEEVVQRLPMVAELTRALGLDSRSIVAPDSRLLLEHDRRGFNVFHVVDAAGSPFVPAQDDFVLRHGVRSVVGFGFAIPPADIFVVILFTRVRIETATADLFKTVALSLKLAALPAAAAATFDAAG